MEKIALRIALVTQYFWPESFSINDMVLELEAQGHHVNVFTGKPNYPDGKIFAGYTDKGFAQERFGRNVTVYRAPLKARGRGGARGLAANYLSFVWNGLRHFHRHAKTQRYDVVFVFTLSPITSAIPAIYLKSRLGTPMVMWVLDLWPESLAATGYVKNRWALSAVGCMVRAIYARSDRILVQSRAFIPAVAKYAKRNKLHYFPNFSADLCSEPSANSMVSNDLVRILDTCFCIVFTGNLGKAQAVETLIEAARNVAHLPDFRLVLVGSGSMSPWLEQEVAKGVNNVILAGRFPANEMPQFFARAQGLLVSLKDEHIYALTVPAKVQSYLAAGKPILASINGEGARVVQEAQAGLVSPAEDAIALAENIEQLYLLSDEERQRMGEAGRRYFLQHFELRAQAQALVKHLNETIAEVRRGKHP